jgi:hypothetical protein
VPLGLGVGTTVFLQAAMVGVQGTWGMMSETKGILAATCS